MLLLYSIDNVRKEGSVEANKKCQREMIDKKWIYLVVIFSVSVSNICMGRDVGIESDD